MMASAGEEETAVANAMLKAKDILPRTAPPGGHMLHQPPSPQSLQDGCRPKRKTKIAQKPGKRNHGLCAVCSEIGKSSQTNCYCFECGRTMCAMCDQNHQSISAFREHTKVSLCLENDDQQLCPKKLDSLICKDHDRMVRKYCWDCERNVCNACLARKHHRHTIKSFAIKTEEDQRQYDELQTLINEKMAELEAKMAQIEAIKEKHQQNFRLLEEKINTHTENVQNQVMVQHQKLRAELTRSQDEKKEKLTRLLYKANAAQKVMDSLMIQAQIARIRKAKLQAAKNNEARSDGTTRGEGATGATQECKCSDHEGVDCSSSQCTGGAEIAACEAEAKDSAIASGAAIELDSEELDPEMIMKNYTFELEPHEDPDATLDYVKRLSKIVGDHIDELHREVQETKDEMASLRFEPYPLDNVSLGTLEIPEFHIPDYEQELEEIRQLAHRLKSGNFGVMADCVSVQEVNIKDATGALCENPFK